ncbi:MAG: DUF1569 domain-containing protein [Planctomycetota bacterium]|nr:DUF1569 domain-containing protein [Planctomycetota bacterium]
MTIDTRRLRERRVLRFESIAALRAELDALEAAERVGALRAIGNWTAGQVFSHLAAFVEYGFDGYPPTLPQPGWLMRTAGRALRGRMLRGPLPAGVRIPGVEGGTVGQDDVPFGAGLARLRAALDRLEREAPAEPNLLLGPLPHEQWIALHLRHAELHLGFLHVTPGTAGG